MPGSENENDGYNAMTIAWGSVGTLCERGVRSRMIPVGNVYVRPSGFTHHLLIENDFFTVYFMDPAHKKNVAKLAASSGKDDPERIEKSGLQLVEEKVSAEDHTGTAAYMKDSDLVFLCRKIYIEYENKRTDSDCKRSTCFCRRQTACGKVGNESE